MAVPHISRLQRENGGTATHPTYPAREPWHYFVVPLVIALVHAVYALCVMNSGFFAPLGVDPMPGILITGAFVLVIYGCYLLVAYLASRRVGCDACGF